MKIDKAKSCVKKALEEIEKCIAQPEKLPKEINQKVLMQCQKHLLTILHQIETLAVPEKDFRERGMGRMIVDSWPSGFYLNEHLLRAEQAYLAVD